MPSSIVVESAPERLAEYNTLSARWLDELNSSMGRERGSQPVVLHILEKDSILGVLTGQISWNWLYINRLAIHPHHRGKGLGSALMENAETHARKAKLIGVAVDTFSFQAEQFYLKLGYTEFGKIPDCPPGENRVFLLKRL